MNTLEPQKNNDFATAPNPAVSSESGVAAAPGNARRPAHPAIEVRDLHCAYGRTEAVHGLSFTVEPGRCYGLFGRNGAGKSTTIKCLLNLLRPRSGSIRVNGISPQKDELAVKHLIGYVPEQVAFHPWMTVERVLRYYAAFRPTWNFELQNELLTRFDLAPDKKVDAMSKGMRSQLGLICAVCPEPQILLLDEPTSGLDPIIRREFLQTVIGAYMESAPGQRTVLVSTHLIGEWEGMIDEFTIVEKGRGLITMQTDDARDRCRRIYLRWSGQPQTIPAEIGKLERAPGELNRPRSSQALAGQGTAAITNAAQNNPKPGSPNAPDQAVMTSAAPGQLTRILTTNYSPQIESRLRALGAEIVEVEPLSLEDIFVAISGTRAETEPAEALK